MIPVIIRLCGACLIGLAVGILVRWINAGSIETSGTAELLVRNDVFEVGTPEANLESLLDEENRVIDQQALIASILTASPAALKTFLDRLDTRNDPVQFALRAIALKRWLQRDLPGAIRYANDRGNDWPISCLMQLAEVDADQAAKAVKEDRFNTNHHESLVVALFTTVAEVDAMRAYALAKEWPFTRDAANGAYQAIFRKLCADDPIHASTLVDALPGSVREMATLSVAVSWGQEDGESAFAWLMEQPNSTMALASLGAVWAASEPQAVLTHLDALSKWPGSREGILGTALSSWWQDDPVAAQEWLSNAALSEKEAESVQQSVISKLMKTDPEGAVKLNAEAVVSGYESVGPALYETWASEDPESLLDWAQEQPMGADRNEGMLAAIQKLSERDPVSMLKELPTLTESMGNTDGWEEVARELIPVLKAQGQEASERWIESLPESARVAFLAAYGSPWGYDPEETLDFLTRRPMTEGLVNAAQTLVGVKLARTDPAAAASIVAEFEGVQMRELGAQNVMANWLATAPAEAEAWAQTLSDALMRDAAYAKLAGHLAPTDLDKAFGYVSQITDVYERHDVSRRLLKRVRRDAEAVAYLESVDLLKADHEDLLQRFRSSRDNL